MTEKLKKAAYTGEGIYAIVKEDESMMSYYKNKLNDLNEEELLNILSVCKASHNKQWIHATILINVYGVSSNIISELQQEGIMKSLKACNMAVKRLREVLKVVDDEDHMYALRGMLIHYKKLKKR